MQIEHEDRRRDVPRKEAMLARRIRQRTRKPGFTPIANRRVDAAIESMTAFLTMGYMKRAEKSGTAMPSSAAIHSEAIRAVASKLPPARSF